jgi:hypothetical protein
MINLEEIQKAQAVLKALNSLTLSELDLLLPPEEKRYTSKDLENWKYVGLNNLSFLREYGIIK